MPEVRPHAMSYYRWRTVASFLPDRLLAFLILHWKLAQDPSDGWTFWLDASYVKWVRADKRKRRSNPDCTCASSSDLCPVHDA
ncbi:MAG TPA: hypothetical protein VNS88_11585 [Nitrospiraceae bacterium]|nr:hypothetical protein [Nitrospiraceae bacterium]